MADECAGVWASTITKYRDSSGAVDPPVVSQETITIFDGDPPSGEWTDGTEVRDLSSISCSVQGNFVNISLERPDPQGGTYNYSGIISGDVLGGAFNVTGAMLMGSGDSGTWEAERQPT